MRDLVALLSTLRRDVLRGLRKRGVPREDAEDYVQEGLLRLFRMLASGEAIRNARGLLFTTVGRIKIDGDRKAHRDLYTDITPEELDAISDASLPEDLVLAQQRYRRMQQILDGKCHPLTAQIFVLHVVHQYTYEDLALRFKKSPRTIEGHMRRAMLTLREELLKGEGESGADKLDGGPLKGKGGSNRA